MKKEMKLETQSIDSFLLYIVYKMQMNCQNRCDFYVQARSLTLFSMDKGPMCSLRVGKKIKEDVNKTLQMSRDRGMDIHHGEFFWMSKRK